MAVNGRPRFAKLSVRDDLQGRLQPYIRTLAAALPLSLMECAGGIAPMKQSCQPRIGMGFALRGQDGRSGTVDEQRSQIGIPPLADAEQGWLSSAA